ncbi:MAG: O-antigen ligase family protein [Capsulimonadaceae bacterium]
MVTVIVAMLTEMPWVPTDIRAILLKVAPAGFLAVVMGMGAAQEDLKGALTRGPAPWLLALLLWCVIEVYRPPYDLFNEPTELRPYAGAELLRVLLNVSVCLGAAYMLRRSDLIPLAAGLVLFGTCIAVFGLARLGASDHDEIDVMAIFGNHEQAGSFLMMFLPIAAAFALQRGVGEKLSWAAQVSTVILAATVIFTRTRSAWIGEFVGLCTLGTLSFLYAQRSQVKEKISKHQLIGPALILIIGLVALVLSSDTQQLLSKRLATFHNLSDDGSLADRLHRWRAGCSMVFERPVTGWGLGSYPVLIRRWTGTSDPPAWVIAHGTGHQNLAHNFWVQWAADAGGVGLVLFIGAVVTFLICGVVTLGRMELGHRRTLLTGCIAAVAGCCADMVGAPSYDYPGVSTLFFLLIGIGIAACRGGQGDLDLDKSSVLSSMPKWIPVVAAAAGLAAVLVIMNVGSRYHPPASMASLLTDPTVPVPHGVYPKNN